MRRAKILLTVKSSWVHSWMSITNATVVEWCNLNSRRFCSLTSSNHCLTNHASSPQVVPKICVPFDTSWLKQKSRILSGASLPEYNVAGESSVEHEITPAYIGPGPRLKMISDYFNVSKTTASRIAGSEPRLKNIDLHNLARNMNTLQEYGIKPDDVRNFLPLLCRCPLTMEHNAAILKELGFSSVTAEHLMKFKKIFKSSISVIKRWGLLPENYEPHEQVLAALGVPEDQVMTAELPSDITHFTLAQVHRELSNVYLSWRLDCSKNDIDRIRRIYSITKSMRLQDQVLHQLNHHWNISCDKVVQNGYLLACSPVNISFIETEVKLIAGTDTKSLVTFTPRILTIPYQQLQYLSSILVKLGVTPGSLKTVPRICTLNPDTIQERITHLQQDPEFKALHSHPRMLRLICYYHTVRSRLDFLQQVKNTNAIPSLNTLSGTRSAFHKYISVGELRQNKRDVINCLAKFLNVKASVIRDKLHLQCWGPQTTVVSVRKNLVNLMQHGFSKEQVMAALDVVLYSPDLLLDQLTKLPHRPQVQPYSKLKSNPNVLQLLLYFMEKNASCTLS
ncbi:transcription termination factor 5, mitochondrial-like [Panulirus ornatus]|uniref:transcription termination factor 5, mitochondrial-like n=1 Tax=Panulirus ornatus TaxID=150431 RepID=UPI003A866087